MTEARPKEIALIPSPAYGEPGSRTAPRSFNMMFQTNVGAMTDASSVAYLRPETAQGHVRQLQVGRRHGPREAPVRQSASQILPLSGPGHTPLPYLVCICLHGRIHTFKAFHFCPIIPLSPYISIC